LAGNTNQTFSKWAPAGTQSSVQLILTVTPGQVIGLPYTSAVLPSTPTGVLYGTDTIQGYNLSGSISTITVGSGITRLHFEFNSTDCGTTIEIVPVDHPRVSTQIADGTPVTATSIAATPPISSSATGSVGQIAYDANYIYVCVAANSWKRAALTTW
jgi:hypothetical protein